MSREVLIFLNAFSFDERQEIAYQLATISTATKRWFAACKTCHALTPLQTPVRRFGIGCLISPRSILEQVRVGVYFEDGGTARSILQVAVVEPVSPRMVNYAQILQLAPGTPAFYWGRESFELGLTAGMLTICNQESYLVDTPVSSLNLQGFYDRLDPLGFFQS